MVLLDILLLVVCSPPLSAETEAGNVGVDRRESACVLLLLLSALLLSISLDEAELKVLGELLLSRCLFRPADFVGMTDRETVAVEVVVDMVEDVVPVPVPEQAAALKFLQ